MPSYKIKYRRIVEGWTVVEAASEKHAREIFVGGITGATHIESREDFIDFVDKTVEAPCAWKPRKAEAPIAPVQQPKVTPADLPDVGEIIKAVADKVDRRPK